MTEPGQKQVGYAPSITGNPHGKDSGMTKSDEQSVPDTITAIEEADKSIAQDAGRYRHHPVVTSLGLVSEIADQIPLSLVCGGVMTAGLISDRPHLARTGVRMMAAHVLANSIKRAIKNRFRRTRPGVVLDGEDYVCEPGETEGGHDTSFPSGHTAGAVAVAAIIASDIPKAAVPAFLTASLIAGVQVPRAKHYPIDIAAGTLLGLSAAMIVKRLYPEK